MPMSPRLLRPRAASGDSDVLRYVAAVEAADGQALEQSVKDAIRDFILGCKTDNTWSAIKASCILMGARTLSGALTPLVGTAPTNVNFVSGDYNRKTGLLSDGSTKHLNSNRKNNADPQDSQHFAAYLSTIPTGLGVLVGAGGGGTGASSVQRSGDSTAGSRSRSSTYTSIGINSFFWTAGLWGKSRTGSSTLTIRIANTNNTLPSPFSVTSQTPSSDDVFVFARNNGSGVADFRANARMAYYSIGEGLNLDTLGARLTTLYTAIGAAIP